MRKRIEGECESLKRMQVSSRSASDSEDPEAQQELGRLKIFWPLSVEEWMRANVERKAAGFQRERESKWGFSTGTVGMEMKPWTTAAEKPVQGSLQRL